MVMAGYSNPAMSFPVVSKDVITGWFSQLLQNFFNVQALNIFLTTLPEDKKQTIEKLCFTLDSIAVSVFVVILVEFDEY